MKKIICLFYFFASIYINCLAQENTFNRNKFIRAFKEVVADTGSGFKNILGEKIYSLKHHSKIALPNSVESYIYKFTSSNYATYYSIFHCTNNERTQTLQLLQESILEALGCNNCSFIHDIDSTGFTCVESLGDGSLVTDISISLSKESLKTQNQIKDVIKLVITTGRTYRNIYFKTNKFSRNNKTFTNETNQLIEAAVNKFETLKSTRVEQQPTHFTALELNSARFPDTLFTAHKIFAKADYAYLYKLTDTMHIDGKVNKADQIRLIHLFNVGKDSLTAEKKMKTMVANCNAAVGDGFYTNVNNTVYYVASYNKKLHGKGLSYSIKLIKIAEDFFVVIDATMWSDFIVE